MVRANDLPNVGHEAATMVSSDPATVSIFADRVVASTSGMSHFGFLDRCDVDMMPHEDTFALGNFECKEVAVPLKDVQFSSCGAGWSCNWHWCGWVCELMCALYAVFRSDISVLPSPSGSSLGSVAHMR